MSGVKNITREELDAVKYGDLKAKLEELGIGSVWQNGVKKADLIETALAKLSEIREKAVVEGDIVEEKLINAEVETPKEPEQSERDQPKKISKEIIEKNLKTIEANLMNNIPGQKLILLQKKKELQELLAKAEN
jgi:hypothetical protein